MYLSDLNEQQRRAVEIINGPLLVLAGAGTGKTKVLTTRIAHIIFEGAAKNDEILAVTFTNKAANEMKERVKSIISSDLGLWIGTFHSIANRILRRHSHVIGIENNFNIINQDDQNKIVKDILKDFKSLDYKETVNQISRWKDKSMLPKDIRSYDLSKQSDVHKLEVYKQYQQRLSTSNCLDFGDLILLNNSLFREHSDILSLYQEKFKFVLVDEYQDTNIAQYLWIRLLTARSKNICCVGDDDQSIYAWRGAEVANILKFTEDFPEAQVIKLEQNYRSTDKILKAASGVIKPNSTRHDKTLWTAENFGQNISVVKCYNDKQEAMYIANQIRKKYFGSNIAILLRSSFLTRSIEEVFINNKINYKIIGGQKFYDRLEIRDVLAYLRVISNLSDDIALERIINTPKRSIGATTLSLIKEHAFKSSICIFEAIGQILPSMKGKTQDALKNIYDLFIRWNTISKMCSPYDLLKIVLNESGYLQMWKDDKDQKVRVENIYELLSAISDYNDLQGFMDHANLVTSDESVDDAGDVSIMTLHASKGLEFDVVFLPAWEDGIIPNARSVDEGGIEEERRIAYVGITRAKKHLIITYASNRRMFYDWIASSPSPFIQNIPKDVVSLIDLKSVF